MIFKCGNKAGKYFRKSINSFLFKTFSILLPTYCGLNQSPVSAVPAGVHTFQRKIAILKDGHAPFNMQQFINACNLKLSNQMYRSIGMGANHMTVRYVFFRCILFCCEYSRLMTN